MSMKHTPGPWRVKGTRVYPSTGIDCICTMQISNQPAWGDDARLIAAAPDLLGVARSVSSIGFHTMPKGQPDCVCSRCEMVREANAAIAKATGGEVRCPLCNYQHGHAIGCKNNPVDIALTKVPGGAT